MISERMSKELMQNISALGALPFYLFLAAFVLLTGEERLALWLLAGLAAAYLVVVPIRAFYYRDRPKKQAYSNILQKIDSSSFPSMHSIRVVAATFMMYFYFNSLAIAALMAFAAGLVIFSRHWLRKHYAVDLAAGIAIGAVIAFAIALFL